MGPIIQERLDAACNEGEKPKDMIQFLINSVPEVERTVPQIIERMMALNMASIHTTTIVSIPTLYVWSYLSMIY